MTFFEKFLFKFPFSHKIFQMGQKMYFLSIVQAVMEVLNKSHFNLQMGNFPIPVAEHSRPNSVVTVVEFFSGTCET